MPKKIKNNRKSIIITGESGLLGSALKLELSREYNLVPFNLDITDFKADKFYQYKDKIDCIIHTAAITKVKQCEENHELCDSVNVAGTKNIVNLARALNSRLIYISTASVFSGEAGNYLESDSPQPKSYYDISKHKGEQIVSEYGEGQIIRLNLIGIHPNGSRGKNFAEWLYDSIKADRDMTLYNDVIVNPLCNWTIAKMIKRIMAEDIEFKILHLGSGSLLSKAEIGRIMIEKIGGYKGKAKIASLDKNSKIIRPKKMWLNVESAETKLKIKMPKIESEIDKILEMNK